MRLLSIVISLALLATPAWAQVQVDPNVLRDAARTRAPQAPTPGPPQDPQTPQTPGNVDRGRIAPGAARMLLCDVVALERAQRALSQTIFPCFDWRAEVSWIRPDGARESYAQWPQARRDRLDQLFMALLTDEPDLGVTCPAAPVLYDNTLSERVAEDIYLVHVAHALMLERERLVPSRLHRLPVAERAVILAPQFYVSRVLRADGSFESYGLPAADVLPRAFDCDPRVGYRFMLGLSAGQSQNLVGESDLATLRNLTTWFRQEVGHGGYSDAQRADHAHLADRLTRYRSYTEDLVGYWAVGGCPDAGAMFADLARAVNIPLLRAASSEAPGGNGRHAALMYAWTRAQARVLHHVDAIYAEDIALFPIDDAGVALSPQAREQLFFDTHWVAPTALAAFGFDFVLRPITRAELGPTARYAQDYGWFVGAWRRGASAHDNEATFRIHKSLATGGALLAARRCASGTDDPYPREFWQDYLNSQTAGAARPLTADDVADRMDSIVRAYGGCGAIRAEIARAGAYRGRPL